MQKIEFKTEDVTTKEKKPIQLLRLKQVIAKLCVSRSTLYGWTNPKSDQYKASFPKSMHLGNSRAVFWIAEELEKWIFQNLAMSCIDAKSDQSHIAGGAL